MPLAAIPVIVGNAILLIVYKVFFWITPRIVKWVLAALGVGLFTYFGMEFLTAYILNKISASYSGIPATALFLFEKAGGVKAINIFFSCVTTGLTVKWTLTGAGSAGIKKYRFLA